jgi:DNA replication ATP-dependent helicase Dna2
MDKIEKSINLTPAEMGPPGSSPLRQHVDARRCRSSSPTKDHRLPGVEEDAGEIDDLVPFEDTKPARMPVLEELSSEFGGDDLDQDFMDLVGASADPFIEAPRQNVDTAPSAPSGWGASAGAKLQSRHSQDAAVPASKPSTSHIPTINETKNDEFDEFEDDYDDLPGNLEEILAKCDQKPAPVTNSTTNPPPANGPKATNVPVNGGPTGTNPTVTDIKADSPSSDDEFDDDFDLEDLEQTMKQAGEGKPAYVSHS